MFRVVTHEKERLKAYCVRSIVFVEEQHCPYELEFDADDEHALHILGEEAGEPFAAARIRFLGDIAKLERIALRKAYRGGRRGHQLVNFLIETAQAHGFSKFKMHAQVHLVDFYEKHGFKVKGEKFEEAGIEHYLMARSD